jgi:hypothetical protein
LLQIKIPALAIRFSKRAGSAGNRIAEDFVELFMMNSRRNPGGIKNSLGKVGGNRNHQKLQVQECPPKPLTTRVPATKTRGATVFN